MAILINTNLFSYKTWLLFIAITALQAIFFTSCNKFHSDTTAPKISFTGPFPSVNVKVPFITTFYFTASDDLSLKYISAQLVDLNQAKVSLSEVVETNEKQLSGSFTLQIDDINLRSGYYDLLLIASDGTNETKAFYRLNLQTSDPVLLGYCAVSGNNPATIYFIDSALQVSQYLLNHDFGLAVHNTFTNSIMIFGKNQASITHFNTNNKSQHLVVNEGQHQFPFYQSATFQKSITYFSDISGQLRTAEKGAIGNFVNLSSGYYAPFIQILDNNLLAQVKNLGASDFGFINYYNTSNKTLTTQKALSLNVQYIYSISSSKDLFFGTAHNTAQVFVFNKNLDTFSKITDLPFAQANNIKAINNGAQFLMATSTGLYLYTVASNNIQLLSAPPANVFDLDSYRNQILFANQNRLILATFPNFRQLYSVLLSDSIAYTAFIYNKSAF